MLTNLFHANDTYANERGMNNDIDCPLKTFAGTLGIPPAARVGEPIPVTGYAQVGISGLSKVQYWLHEDVTPEPAMDNYYAEAPWQDAELLPPPNDWGGGGAEHRLVRGGEWNDNRTPVKNETRESLSPGGGNAGFRLVRP